MNCARCAKRRPLSIATMFKYQEDDSSTVTKVDPLKRAENARREKAERNHGAIARGRHPRSFGLESDLWKHIKRANARRINVLRGQGLSKVASSPTFPQRLGSRGSSGYASSAEGDDDQGYSNHSQRMGLQDQSGRNSDLSMINKDGKKLKVESAIRPLSPHEVEIMAQLEKHAQIQEKHGSTERRGHKLGRRMSVHRITDAKQKNLPSMIPKDEQGNRINFARQEPSVYDDDDDELPPPPRRSHHKQHNPAMVPHGAHPPASPMVTSGARTPKSARDVRVKKISTKKETLPEFTSIENATVFYGSVVAFQTSDGKFLTIQEDTGKIVSHHWPEIEKYGIRQKATHPGPDAQNGRMLFTLYDMRNPANQEPIRFGDPVWLAVCPGNGIKTWQKGSCLAARIMTAPKLCTIGLEASSIIRNPNQETQKVGNPVPLPCVVHETGMKNADNMWLQGPMTKENPTGWYSNRDLMYEKLYKERSAAIMTLGRWMMLPTKVGKQESIRRTKASYATRTAIESLLDAHGSHREDKEGYEFREMCTGDEVIFEQDWFYISSTPGKIGGEIILRQLPGTNNDNSLDSQMNKIKSPLARKKGAEGAESVYEIDRRGVFKIRLISGGERKKGKNKEALKVEATFHHARQQLKISRKFREGGTVEYENGAIKGGGKFCTALRDMHKEAEVANDNMFLGYEDEKVTRLESYFDELYEDNDTKILNSLPASRSRQRATSFGHILPSSRTTRGSIATTTNLVEDRFRQIREKELLKLFHKSVVGPHINLFTPDRQVSARLSEERRKALEKAAVQAYEVERLNRLMSFDSIPESSLPSRGTSRSGSRQNSRPTSRVSSRPVSSGAVAEKYEKMAKAKYDISDEQLHHLLGMDSIRPMENVIDGEDNSMEKTILASRNVLQRADRSVMLRKEQEKRDKAEAARKNKLFEEQIKAAEQEAKFHEYERKRAEAEVRRQEEEERLRVHGGVRELSEED